ncbi:hypothetical protein BXA22_03935 [Edwardsiella piscicida]|nr:hypothetical protein BXA22_03935 [Edwardsiella piscicida]
MCGLFFMEVMMKPSPVQFTRVRRCSYCGSRAHAVQFCPKTHAGMVRIEQRAAMSRQQKEMEGNGNAAKNTQVLPRSRVWVSTTGKK